MDPILTQFVPFVFVRWKYLIKNFGLDFKQPQETPASFKFLQTSNIKKYSIFAPVYGLKCAISLKIVQISEQKFVFWREGFMKRSSKLSHSSWQVRNGFIIDFLFNLHVQMHYAGCKYLCVLILVLKKFKHETT